MMRQHDTNYLAHHGVKGQKWGVRRYQNADGSYTARGRIHYGIKRKTPRIKEKIRRSVVALGVKIRPAQVAYAFKRAINKPDASTEMIAKYTDNYIRETGQLPTEPKALQAVESMGIEKHKNAVYDNLSDTDIKRFKRYTDSALYSRIANTYLATGVKNRYSNDADQLKKTLAKNQINDTTVYRSCFIKYSTGGIRKKMDEMGEEELKSAFDSLSKNFAGKKINENRILSTSTSPIFAVDGWRKMNPTASQYNAYMIIDCKGTNGIFADGRTKDGKTLVNSRYNQECILAPNQLQYRSLSWDDERKMFAIRVDAL